MTAGSLIAGCGGAPAATAPKRNGASASAHHNAGSPSGVTGGVAFGGNEPLVAESPALGRHLTLARTYYRIGEPFPDAADRSLMKQGTSLVVSLDLQPGAAYGEVTSGRDDGLIRAFLRSMAGSARQYGLKTIYFCFQHEPDSTVHGADPSGFVHAWDHVHDLAQHLGVDWQQGGPVHWVWILTHRAYVKGVDREYWPGSSRVDIVGIDAYNTAGCKKTPSGSNFVATTSPALPAALFGGALSFAESEEKPLFITEWGSVPGPTPTSRSQFIQSVMAYVGAHKDIAAAMYWDGHGHHNGCDYSIDGDAATLSALATAASSPSFRGSVTGAPRGGT